MAEHADQRMSSAQLQEEIWRAEAELEGLQDKARAKRRANWAIRATTLFILVFCLLVTAINSGSPIAYLGGVGMLLAGVLFFFTFFPDRALQEEKVRIEGELYVLRKRWGQALIDENS